jgi:hypothetical protein
LSQHGKEWTETRDGRAFKIGNAGLGAGASGKDYI